jgi:serine/threonine-protein kinase
VAEGDLLTALHDRLQAHFRGTYTIVRELGGGGMSSVFLADEERFGRQVVIKVLPADVSGAVSVERFEREIALAARLQHPHIVPLLTAGDADGLLYYTMPYVQGETVRDRIVKNGRLPIADALRIAIEVADALVCAHQAGVVHRDIKPENLLLSAGHAMVADFGIAKAISTARTTIGVRDDARLTQLGTAIGTAAYMSPEQAAGDSDLDGRSDIYSLGCVLYEMLAGRQPFTGPSAAAVIAKRFSEVPAGLRTVDGAIPADLESVVTRAMARERRDRFPSAGDALRALTSATVQLGSRVADDKPSVAVLPFTNTSGNPDDEYFSDGMTEEVINALAHLSGIRVAARTSSFVFKGQRVDLRSIAEQLRVQTILEGGVRRAGHRVRISVQLVSASDGLHLWSERYDRDLADVFALQDEIGQAIAAALDQRLGTAAVAARREVRPDGPDRAARAAVVPEAYDVYLRGRFFFEQHQPLEAIDRFQRATALDPTFALAHTWTGYANILAANLHLMPARTGYPRARAAADQALALDPQLADAILTRAFVALWFDWDRPNAERLARDLTRLAAELPMVHELRGWTLLVAEQFADGVAALERAYELDPLSDFMLHNTAFGLTLSGNPERAIELLHPGLSRSPRNSSLHLALGFALAAAGRATEARATLERARHLLPTNLWLMGTLAGVLAAAGEGERARVLLAEAEERAGSGEASAIEVACIHHALGNDDGAFLWLERAFNARDLWMCWLHLDPRLRALHDDSRFAALIRRVGMAPGQWR